MYAAGKLSPHSLFVTRSTEVYALYTELTLSHFIDQHITGTLEPFCLSEVTLEIAERTVGFKMSLGRHEWHK